MAQACDGQAGSFGWRRVLPGARSRLAAQPGGQRRQRPRETRSISALTMRSTNPGRLSSSQDFSIGLSISLTRSSRVRAFWLSTVWARLLKADSTAETVERDRICAEAT